MGLLKMLTSDQRWVGLGAYTKHLGLDWPGPLRSKSSSAKLPNHNCNPVIGICHLWFYYIISKSWQTDNKKIKIK